MPDPSDRMREMRALYAAGQTGTRRDLLSRSFAGRKDALAS